MKNSRRRLRAVEALEPICLLSGAGMPLSMGDASQSMIDGGASLSLLGSGRAAWVATFASEPPAAPNPAPPMPTMPTDPTPSPSPTTPTRAEIEQAARIEAAHYTMMADDMDMGHHGHDMGAGLVPFDQATHIAILDGPWSSPETWMDRQVPQAGARVWIMPGRTVTVDSTIAPAAQWVRVSGAIQFASDRDTSLRVDTMVVDSDGQFVMGTAESPIRPEVQARLIFTGDGPIDRVADPGMMGRGLIVDGAIQVHGADVTDWLGLARFPRAGDTTLQLSRVPEGWKVGDTLVLAGTTYTEPAGMQDEVLTIAGISGTTVQLTAPLRFDHLAPTMADLASRYGQAPSGAPLEVHVAHLTRNARFESETPGPIESRGHVMVMSPHAEFDNAGFYGLGRTDKSRLISDDNPRARYALHFHRVGPDTDPIRVNGCVVDGSPGWGIDNHSSNVDVSDCVVYNVVGSAYTSEAGDERGSFRDSIAIHVTGSTTNDLSLYFNSARHKIGDLGYAGHGFWMESPQVALSGNVVAGAANAAYIYYPSDFEGLGNRPERETIREFRDNTAYSSRMGVWFWTSSPTSAPHVIEGFTAWGLYGAGFGADYTRHVVLEDSRLIGNPYTMATLIDSGQDFSYINNYVVGYQTGLVPGFGPGNVVRGNYLNNQVDVLVQKNANVDNAMSGPRQVTIEDNQIKGGGVRLDGSTIRPGDPIFWTWFAPEEITWDGRRLYYAEQAPDYVVRGTGMAQPDGKTNAELARDLGLAIAGAVAPSDATTIPGLSGGRASLPTAKPPALLNPLLPNAAYPQSDGSHDVVLWDTINQKRVTFFKVPASQLHPGLNLVRLLKNGQLFDGFAIL